MQVSFTELFGYRYIKRFYFARFISNFGNGMSPIALAFGILHLPNGDANLLSLVLGATTVAMLVMSPFGGVLADKFGRIRAVAFADLVGATGLFVQVAYFATGNVPIIVLLIVNINFGLMWGIFWPAMSGVLPALVPDEHLQKTNSVNNLFSNGAIILGAAVGGIIVAGWGSTWALAIDAATFVVGGVLLFSFRHVSVKSEPNENSMFDDLIHGWKIFISYRWIVIGVFGFSFIILAWAAGENILGPLIALEEFNGAKSWSLVLTFEGIGLLIGSIIGIRMKFKYPLRFLLIISFSISLYMWSMARPQSIWFIAFCALLWGITIDLWTTIWSTAMAREVPREALSRVSSFDAMGTMLLRPVGLAIAGPLSMAIGLSNTLYALAIFSAILILGMLATPVMRNMQIREATNKE
ncbi:MAG: MFS transporter [Actinobacteria bacterium]|nr:MFS transporter [Actinomycetota bacterium]MSW22559.1 MFS transporter [Actinomycetota bacterium]MSX03755.1 MFS transporter [Actinomycetota bacterium]MSX61030.1 MFS transporter [Actinomycetota bacterium]MSX83849.1 MFS transporter [Actinomycetota bacterium]